MSIETKSELCNKTIAQLQELIRINIDSKRGFQEVADNVENTAIAETFRMMAAQRSANVEQLHQFCLVNGEDPNREGSYVAKLHRVWIKIRDQLSSNDTHAMLCEAERGEDYIKAAYEAALIETAGSAVNDVLTRQYTEVKAAHDRVRDLRDAFSKQ